MEFPVLDGPHSPTSWPTIHQGPKVNHKNCRTNFVFQSLHPPDGPEHRMPNKYLSRNLSSLVLRFGRAWLPARETFVIKHLEDLALLESVSPCLLRDKLSKLTFTFTVIFTEFVTSKQKLESKSLAMPLRMRMRVTMMGHKSIHSETQIS